MISKVALLLFAITVVSPITGTAGDDVTNKVTCDQTYRGVKTHARCSTDGYFYDCSDCTDGTAKGLFCVHTKGIPSKLPDAQTPGVVKDAACINYEKLTRDNKPFGYGCSTGKVPQSLFCNDLDSKTIPTCQKCKKGGKRPDLIV
ncbi:uncharacterized protein MELLADRAFT_124212 [Melampsora larici-populina 98AG31]|uniref:Secreted protein n=1 Tax=Melampsora larici-populina (strain 98AG31 / pathotype 3-4-7) TaxID=747676 RepID=F4RMQ6_MELLP|nr:uncharacterized protein MELLADRAFT_124212 [Melampsora larici-populina 98AG31]EGG06151.1 secreted protein [Melampsora larici-populina 98AG31]